MKHPHNIKQLRVVLGLIGFYRKFFGGFGKTAKPLYNFYNRNEKIFLNEFCEKALKEVKEKPKQHQYWDIQTIKRYVL